MTDLHDQPIGLLRYLKDIRGWIASQLGARRDSSYEVSNLVTFTPSTLQERCAVREMIDQKGIDRIARDERGVRIGAHDRPPRADRERRLAVLLGMVLTTAVSAN